MKVLLIGLGSIARKHLAALRELRPHCAIYALRSGSSSAEVEDVQNIFEWGEIPTDIDFAMICNPTSEHYSTIKKVLHLEVPIFIEKPPFMNTEGVHALIKLAEEKAVKTYIAFNFRFHPVIQWLKENLIGKRVLEVQAYCGSYLPNWRPGRDYREVYSAKNELGGGVHLDLIHELDYLVWLFGEPIKLDFFCNKVSDLEIDSPDVAHYWLRYPVFNISVLLNYYRKDAMRKVEIVMDDNTWTADLIKGKITNGGGERIFEDKRPVADTYRDQMRYFLDGLCNDRPYMNSLSDSLKTLNYCLGGR
jgi:predicted dehydrogenase